VVVRDDYPNDYPARAFQCQKFRVKWVLIEEKRATKKP